MNIMIVEDEDYIAELIQRALEDLGISSVMAPSADDADAVLSEQSVDAVTLDLGMPGRHGLDWLEEIADTQPELAQKTLVITGLELDPDSVERVARCGAGVLSKPFTLDAFHEAVRNQLTHMEYRRKLEN